MLNFVVGGLLLMAFAAGLRQALRHGRGSTWGPILVAAAGAALVVAGLVPTDPALGYPPEQPAVVTVAGRIHGLVGLVLFAGFSAAAFVLARARTGDSRMDTSRGWTTYSRISGALIIAFAYRLDVQDVWRPAPRRPARTRRPTRRILLDHRAGRPATAQAHHRGGRMTRLG